MRKAAEEKYHILQEGSLDDSAHTMALISYLKEKDILSAYFSVPARRKTAGKPSTSFTCSSG